MRKNRSLRYGLLLIGAVLLLVEGAWFYRKFVSTNEDYQPNSAITKNATDIQLVVPPRAPLVLLSTPETDRIADEALAAYRKERALFSLDALRGSETFLTADEQYFKTNKASDADLEKIRKTLALFSSMAEQINDVRTQKKALSSEDTAYVKRVERRLSALQQRTLAGLRAAFCKRSASMLWEQDIVVRCLGTGSTTITFTGWLFASNSEIKKVQEQLGGRLTELRFKLSRYQPHEDGKGWQNTLSTPPDSAIRLFKHGNFEELAK